MGTEGDGSRPSRQDFEKANPDAEVNVTAIPWEAAHNKISGAIAAARAPT